MQALPAYGELYILDLVTFITCLISGIDWTTEVLRQTLLFPVFILLLKAPKIDHL